MRTRSIGLLALSLAAAGALTAQESHPMSPRGTASVQVLGKWVKPAQRVFVLGQQSYEGGKWIEISYGRPLKRGRDVFGSGANYGKAALIGAPIWRAGADMSTRLKTEVPLILNGKTVPAGEYSLFVELKEGQWTLVVSSWPAQLKYDPANKDALWGAYNYTADKDVLRMPMKLGALPFSREQLTWEFLDTSDKAGTIALSWDKTMATVAFKVAE